MLVYWVGGTTSRHKKVKGKDAVTVLKRAAKNSGQVLVE